MRQVSYGYNVSDSAVVCLQLHPSMGIYNAGYLLVRLELGAGLKLAPVVDHVWSTSFPAVSCEYTFLL